MRTAKALIRLGGDLSLHWAHSHFVGFVMSWLNYTVSKVLNLCSSSLFFLVDCRVDPDSALFTDLQTYKEKEGRDHILLNCSFKVSFILYNLFSC